jgi:hypothetical protein
VLDHLHDGCRVESLKPRIAVHERAVQQSDAFALFRRQALEFETGFGNIESPARHIHPDDVRKLVICKQTTQQLPFPAPEVKDARRSRRFQHREYRFEPTLVQADRSLQRTFLFLFALRNRFLFGVFLGSQPGDRVADEPSLMYEVSRHDRIARRVRVEPPLATPNQLLDFVVSNPVVLLVVENWDQDVQVGEEFTEAARRTQRHSEQAAWAERWHAFVEWMSNGIDVVTEGLK